MRIRHTPLLLVALTVAACGGGAIYVNPVAPTPTATLAYTHGVSAIGVIVDPSMPADRTQILMDYGVPAAMQNAMAQGLAMASLQRPQGVGLQVQVAIHHFRWGFGPARLGARVTVFDPAGQVVEQYERESVSMRGGSKSSMLTRLAQDLTEKILNEI